MSRSQTSTFVRSYRSWLIPAAIVLLASVIRIIYLNQLTAMPTFDHPVMDEQYHLELAERINSASGYGPEPYFRAPLYPYLFAFLYQWTHHSLYWARFVQIALGSLLPLIVYLLGTRLFTRPTAIAAALVTALYPTFIYHDVTILITSLKTLMAGMIILQSYRTERDLRVSDFALSGIILGVATLARPNFAVVVPALLIWIWIIVKPRIGLKGAMARYAILASCMVVAIAPVTIRNFVVSGEFVPVAWQGGFNFFLGNNRLATGWSATVPGLDYTWDGGYRDAISVAETRMGGPLKRSEISDFWYDQGWDEIRANQGHFFGLAAKKLRLFFTGYEIPNNEDMYVVRQFSPVIRPLMFADAIKFPYGILAPLALIGMALGLRLWRRFLLVYLFIASYIASFLLFFVCARYRQPIIPFLILFALYGVQRVSEAIRRRDKRTLIAVGIALGGLVPLCNYDRLGLDPARTAAENNFMFGNVYLDQGELDRAAEYFKEAVASDSTFAPPYVNLGIVYTQIRLFDDAKKAYAKAISLEPQTIDAYYNLAAMLIGTGELAAAASWLERALKVNPLSAPAHALIALAYFEQHRFGDSRRSVVEALRLDPSNKSAGKLRRELDQMQEDHGEP